MTFDEFCEKSSFTSASGREPEMMCKGLREYVAQITTRANVILRLEDTHDDVYMAGVERETKKDLYDFLRREFAYDVGSNNYRTADGTLHMHLEVVPERIDVTQPDSRGREVYSAKVHRFEQERGECRNDSLKRGVGVFVCSECGVYLDITDMREEDLDVFYEPKYCPNCGRKMVGA